MPKRKCWTQLTIKKTNQDLKSYQDMMPFQTNHVVQTFSCALQSN